MIYVIDDQTLFDRALARLNSEPEEVPSSVLVRPHEDATQVRQGVIHRIGDCRFDSFDHGVSQVDVTVRFMMERDNMVALDKMMRSNMRLVNLVLAERGDKR